MLLGLGLRPTLARLGAWARAPAATLVLAALAAQVHSPHPRARVLPSLRAPRRPALPRTAPSFRTSASPSVSSVAVVSEACVSPLSAALNSPARQVGLHYRAIDQSGNTHVRDLGRAHLAPLPHGAIMVSQGDLVTNSMRHSPFPPVLNGHVSS
jgi:hypothetical protein